MVPVRAASVHQRDAPAAKARRRAAGVRTRASWSTTKGTGATATRGPPAYLPTRKVASGGAAARSAWS
eukprot:7153-Pleurochrysis_carterae.AAC.1